MTSDEIKSWFFGEYSEARQAEMERWFIANIDSPELDAALNDILKYCDTADRERTLRAFHDTCHRLGLAVPVRKRGRNRRLWRTIGIGTAAALAGLAIGLSRAMTEATPQAHPEWVEVYASAGSTDTVVLPDSSTLQLSPRSILIYETTSFATCREVYLHGGAYAEITPDAAHPFTIRSKQASVEVLGTRFDFSNYAEDSEMEVRLYEGRVSLLANFAGPDTIQLTEGKVAKVDKATGARQVLDIRGLDRTAHDSFHFINKELEDIAHELSRYFATTIVIENEDLKSRKFYAIFANHEGLDQILDALNASGQMEIQTLADNTVVIR